MPTSSPATVPSKCPSLSSSVASTTTATARDDEIVKPFDPNNKMTAEIFGALTKALVLRERRLCEQTKRDEEELARFCELLGLSGDANASCEKAGIERLKVDQTLRGIAQAELAANLLGEAIRRNQREGEAIRCETLELKRMTERMVDANNSLPAIFERLKLRGRY